MGTIKDLPISDRPREKALKYGINVLSDSELLAVLIQSGTKNKSALEIALELICYYKGINNVFTVSLYDLCKINGISKIKALQILAIKELFIRIDSNKMSKNLITIKLSCALDVYNYIHLKILSEFQERMMVIYLNIKNEIIYEETITVGNDSMSVTNNKLICKTSIEKYAKKVIVCHNHPSGNSSPSIEDISTTYSLQSALAYIQVKLLDHLIICKNEFYSILNEQKYTVNC